jgi:hypothetical protein
MDHMRPKAASTTKWSDGEFGMLDVSMIVVGLVMFVLLPGYAPLCDKSM